MIWRGANCDRCWKSHVNEKTGKSRCAIENAIALGSATDGSFLAGGIRTPAHAARLAKRLGWDGVSYLETDCPERE
jgi:pyridoxal biosynthesis lyase PdxS